MEILRYPAGVYQANCYIVFDENAREGFIIDPGGDGEEIINIIRNKGLNIKFILLTHGHFDHNGGVNIIKKEFGIPLYMNEKDTYLVLGGDTSESIKAERFVKDGDKLYFGEEELEIIETPGHTPGGITIKVKDSLFTGDTLFLGSVGRSDLPGGSHATLIESIKKKLLILKEDTRVYPGHGASTSIGREKAHNPFL